MLFNCIRGSILGIFCRTTYFTTFIPQRTPLTCCFHWRYFLSSSLT